MARWRRVAMWSVLSVVVLLLVAITATIGWRPFIGPKARPLTDRKFESTPARLERGQYIFNTRNACVGCHSEWDRSQDGHPPRTDRVGAGKTLADEAMPWLTAPNLTADAETGAGTWTDDMLARAIREGIGHDGRALFPMMPYGLFKDMSDEDLASLIVYIRTLPPVRNPLPKTAIPFPPGPLINAVPQPVTAPVPEPDKSQPVRYGEYLVKMAVCSDCHSPMDEQGNKLPGLDFAGGMALPDGGKTVFSRNITQDASGIPYYDEALFLSTMKTGKVIARDLDDMMPWAVYRNLKDEDLKAMWAYIRTLKPVKHTVDNALPPTACAICKQSHGGGDQNH